MSSEAVLEVRGLVKSYRRYKSSAQRFLAMAGWSDTSREHIVLNNVNFSLGRGETLGIIGRNGAGKSTLLQVICGTVRPSQGSVLIRGRAAAMLELGAGFNHDFSGRENVVLTGVLHGLSRSEIEQRMEAVAEFADLGGFFEEPVRTYSSGMLVRLAFAAIAHVDADLLIIDEALAVGDAFFVQKCMRFLREFQKRGSLLFVSHDSSAITALCGRAIWLEQGCIRAEGPAKAISEAYLAHSFDPRAGAPKSAVFGAGGARIAEVCLQAADGSTLSLVTGGESAALEIVVEAHREILGAIVGFYVKDRLGQNLFGDNTAVLTHNQPLRLNAGARLQTRFEFTMPALSTGTYTIAVAVAEGVQEAHTQLEWVHDALAFQASSPRGCTGLVGIPMRSIGIHIV